MVARVLKKRASNCLPWPVVICWGQPKRATQTETKALEAASAVMSDRGSASGQRVSLSMVVRQYRQPEKTGSGPARSICTWEKRADGRMKFPRGALTCRVTLDRLQLVHKRVHARQSFATPGHTNRWETNLTVALAPGWLKPWRVWKTWRLKCVVMSGRSCRVDVSAACLLLHRNRVTHWHYFAVAISLATLIVYKIAVYGL